MITLKLDQYKWKPPYNHYSAYLWWLFHRTKLSHNEIYHFFLEIEKWSYELWLQNPELCGNWVNSQYYTDLNIHSQHIRIPNAMLFNNEEDLLIFKLRFGIGT